MQACRYALEVVAKHPIYLLVYVGFLSLMGLFITSGVYPPATSAGYESAEVPFAVIDRDQSDLSRSVAAFLEERGTSVEVADEARACQDAVATGLVDYLLIVPAGFEEGYLAAARDGGDGPRLETVFSFQSMAATLVDTQVNQYLGLVRAAAVLEPDSSPEVLVAQAEASAQKEPRIEEVSVPGVAVGSEAFVFYLMWSAYPLTVAVVVSVGILMGPSTAPTCGGALPSPPPRAWVWGCRRRRRGSSWRFSCGPLSWASALSHSAIPHSPSHRPILPACWRWSSCSCSSRWPSRFCWGSWAAARVCRTPWATSPAWC